MAGNDVFEAITEYIKQTGQAILTETDGLKQQTDSLLGQIDDTCKKLPIYPELESGFVVWKQFLERSNTERTRIGTTLQKTGEYIEQNESELKASLTPVQQGQP